MVLNVSWKLKGKEGWDRGVVDAMSTRARKGRKMLTLRVGPITLAMSHRDALRLADGLVDCVEADVRDVPRVIGGA